MLLQRQSMLSRLIAKICPMMQINQGISGHVEPQRMGALQVERIRTVSSREVGTVARRGQKDWHPYSLKPFFLNL